MKSLEKYRTIGQRAPVILKPWVHEEDPQEDVHCVVKQHIQLKYVPRRGGHLPIMFFGQEPQPSKIVKENKEIDEQLGIFYHIHQNPIFETCFSKLMNYSSLFSALSLSSSGLSLNSFEV